jgi:hypothetical protein
VYAPTVTLVRPARTDTQARPVIERRMARHLFLVSRRDARLYEYLLERFRDDANVEVILDRRQGERRKSASYAGPDRRRTDRRSRREVDLELGVRSHVILTIPDDPASPTAKD